MALANTADEESPSLKAPGFGLATATFVVVSSMIGTGVLTTSGFTVYFVGSNQLMLALWVIGGLVALCGALTVAELAASLPRSGGDYVYLYEAYGPLAAFLSGWVSFLIGFGGPIALSAFAAAKYLLVPLHLDESITPLAQKGVATLAILAFALVHSSGRTGTVRVQGGATLLKLGILGLLAVAGLAAGWGRWDHFADRPPWRTCPPSWRSSPASSTSRMATRAGMPPPTWPARSRSPGVGSPRPSCWARAWSWRCTWP